MPVNLGTLAAGIGSGIKSLGDTYSNIPVRLARAQLMGSQQAIADQKMQNAIDTRAAMQYLADSTGIDPRLLGGAADAAEGLARLKLNNGIRLNRAAGQLDPVGEVIAATENLQAQNNPSFSENASVTPPISQLFRKAPVDPAQAPLPAPEPGSVEAARQESMGNIQRNAQLIDMLQTVGAIQNALNGGAMYQSTAQGGAFNRYTGEGSIADQGLRDLYENNLQNQIDNRNQRTQISQQREVRQARNTKTKGSGLGGGARYIEQERHGLLGQFNTKTKKWTPYSKIVQEGRNSAPEPQDTGEFKPNARRLKALEQYRNGKISYDELVRVR